MEKKIGEIVTGKNSRVIFAIKEYRGVRYASIRKYIKSSVFEGYTKQGLSVSKSTFSQIHHSFALNIFPLDIEKVAFKDEGKLFDSIKVDSENRINILGKVYKNGKYIIIQRCYTSPKYTGPGHGVGFSVNKISELFDVLNKVALSWEAELEEVTTGRKFILRENNQIMTDMWILHRDTKKIAKIMGLGQAEVRERLIELDLI